MSKNKDQSDGQVSEVASMDPDALDQPISDDQGVAGNPEGARGDDGGQVEAGPNAKPTANVESGPEDAATTRK